MVTLQEYLDQKYPTREEKEKVEEINILDVISEMHSYQDRSFERRPYGGELDLREYKNLRKIFVIGCHLATPMLKIDLSNCIELTSFVFYDDGLPSVDFLTSLPNPKKLVELQIHSNRIKSTDISIFKDFINLENLQIGTCEDGFDEGKRNHFYGSFESLKNLTKLKYVGISGTDVDRGLEYLPSCKIVCSVHNGWWSDNYHGFKCFEIQNQLPPYNYDVGAWKLANPELMQKVKPSVLESERVELIKEKILET